MHPQLRAWAQLVRVPNTLTACADVLAGFTLIVGWWQFSDVGPSLVAISMASVCLYWAGMVLNDVNDVEADRAQRRNGPLVLGQIAVGKAKTVGFGLLILGVCLAGMAAYVFPSSANSSPRWIVILMAALLAIAIVAYDSSLKAKPIGPILMGLCRGLNLLMGVSLGLCIRWPVELEWMGVAFATLGHIAFVVGITLAARREGMLHQSTVRLLSSWSVSLFGVMMIALCSLWSVERELRLDPMMMFPLLVGLLALPWLRRAMVSIHEPGIVTLVAAIKQAILTIIFLDAAIALQFGGNLPGMVVCGLAIPTLALSRIFRVT
jgi:4-hydroxybenzoate polyprenyltransferase